MKLIYTIYKNINELGYDPVNMFTKFEDAYRHLSELIGPVQDPGSGYMMGTDDGMIYMLRGFEMCSHIIDTHILFETYEEVSQVVNLTALNKLTGKLTNEERQLIGLNGPLAYTIVYRPTEQSGEHVLVAFRERDVAYRFMLENCNSSYTRDDLETFVDGWAIKSVS